MVHSSGRWRLPGTKTALVLVKDQLRLPPHLLCHIHLEGFNHAMALLHDGSIGSFLHLSRDETMLITLIRCPILNDDCFGACHGYSTLFEISSSLGYGRSRASRSDAGRREVFVVVVIFGDKTVLPGRRRRRYCRCWRRWQWAEAAGDNGDGLERRARS